MALRVHFHYTLTLTSSDVSLVPIVCHVNGVMEQLKRDCVHISSSTSKGEELQSCTDPINWLIISYEGVCQRFENGSTTESSDLDLKLVFAEGSHEADTFKSGSNGDKIKLLFQVSSMLITYKKGVNIRDLESIPCARVKIAKFVAYKHHFAVDLSFSNHLVS
nr:hypothetical transcript [Hymenolepis microstoma]